MTTGVKPNFNIIEGYTVEVDYDKFKEDYLNPYILANDVRKKHGLSVKQYDYYRKKVLDETGLCKKPYCPSSSLLKDFLISRKRSGEYIQSVDGFYIVVKTIAYHTHYFGRYADYDTARMVRDKLIECDWDVEVGEELKQIHGVHRLKPNLDRAKEVYDSFEWRYFYDRDSTIADIREKLGISVRTYEYLLMMLRENHGRKVSRRMYD